MNSPTHADASSPTPPRPSRAELVVRVRELLPDLSPGGSDFRTALLYLASRWTPNVDRLAAFTACEREFVARRARRWADHGLWSAAAPGPGGADPDALLRAVAIGEGRVPRPEPAASPEGEPGPGTQDAGPGASLLPDPAPVAGASGREGEVRLAALWSRLGLSTASGDRRQHPAA